MAYEIQFEAEGTYTRFYGVVTAEEIIAASGELWNNPKWDTFRYELADVRDVTSLDLDYEDALTVAYIDNAAYLRSQRRKVAIIATDPDVVARVETYVETVKKWEWEARIFEDLDAARDWVKT